MRGNALLIALPAPALVHWSVDGWQTARDTQTQDTELGLHAAELDAALLGAGDQIEFTFQWRDSGQWIGQNFRVAIDGLNH
jgi:glucoamylase